MLLPGRHWGPNGDGNTKVVSSSYQSIPCAVRAPSPQLTDKRLCSYFFICFGWRRKAPTRSTLALRRGLRTSYAHPVPHLRLSLILGPATLRGAQSAEGSNLQVGTSRTLPPSYGKHPPLECSPSRSPTKTRHHDVLIVGGRPLSPRRVRRGPGGNPPRGSPKVSPPAPPQAWVAISSY